VASRVKAFLKEVPYDDDDESDKLITGGEKSKVYSRDNPYEALQLYIRTRHLIQLIYNYEGVK